MKLGGIMRKNHNLLREERRFLAGALRSAAIFGLHESIANHFSLRVSEEEVLINPPRYFPLIQASELLHINVHDMDTPKKHPIDPTAWSLHGAIHRECPHVGAAFHVHSMHATVLACLENPRLPAIDQNSAMFFERVIIDEEYGGLAFADEGQKVANILKSNPKAKVLIMANHGIMVVGKTAAQALTYLYYFERSAETLIRAYQSGQKLRFLSDDIARQVAIDTENYGQFDTIFMQNMLEYLDKNQPDYQN